MMVFYGSSYIDRFFSYLQTTNHYTTWFKCFQVCWNASETGDTSEDICVLFVKILPLTTTDLYPFSPMTPSLVQNPGSNLI